MDKQQIGLKLTLDGLGMKLVLDSFPGRLILQKTIYLAQAAGVQLGYSFHWYLRGPYSPALTRDAFALTTESEEDPNFSSWKLDHESIQRLGRIRSLFQVRDQAELAKKAELLASVHFLRRSQAGSGKNRAELRGVLQRFGKEYSEEDIQAAFDELTRYDLLPDTAP